MSLNINFSIKSIPPHVIYILTNSNVLNFPMRVTTDTYISPLLTIPTGSTMMGNWVPAYNSVGTIIGITFNPTSILLQSGTNYTVTGSSPTPQTASSLFNNAEVNNSTIIDRVVIIGVGSPSQSRVAFFNTRTMTAQGLVIDRTEIVLTDVGVNTTYYEIPDTAVSVTITNITV